MPKKSFLYFTRFLSAFCLFLLIAKANIWVGAASNTILVLGYRFCILLAPFFLIFGTRNLCTLAFSLTLLGVIGWYFSIYFIGALLIAIGIAVGGYTLKFHAAQTPKGAASNKIAINMGIIFSGLAIACLPFTKNGFLWIVMIALLICIILSFVSTSSNIAAPKNLTDNFSTRSLFSIKGCGWALIGIALGIKMIAIFSILPQYLIQTEHHLPQWYGFAITINALVIVFLQKTIMQFVKTFSFKQVLLALVLAMLLIGSACFLHLASLIMAMLWTFILSVLECVVTYLDTLATHDGALLPKETFWGVGSALTVLLARTLPIQYSTIIVAVVGLIAIIGGMFLISLSSKRTKTT